MPEFTSGVEYKTLSCLVYCPAAGGNHARNLNPGAASILTGCATRSSDIAAAYVSPIPYQASRPPDDVLEDRIDDAVDLDLVEPEGRFAVATRHPFEKFGARRDVSAERRAGQRVSGIVEHKVGRVRNRARGSERYMGHFVELIRVILEHRGLPSLGDETPIDVRG